MRKQEEQRIHHWEYFNHKIDLRYFSELKVKTVVVQGFRRHISPCGFAYTHSTVRSTATCPRKSQKGLKVHKHETRDFWKSYSIRPRYSTFKHFAYAQPAMQCILRMLSQRWNSIRVCSVSDEIRSAYAQHGCTKITCKNCLHFTAGWACAKIRSSYAQCAMKSFPRMLSVR